MSRTRISTTVDGEMLERAREIDVSRTDSQVIDAALDALLRHHRRHEIDRTYSAAYADQPLNDSDDWGDLDGFRSSAAAT